MRRFPGVAALALAAACSGVDIVALEPNVPPTMVVTLAVIHRDQVEYRVDAFLTRGTNQSGRARSLLDSTLVVEGEVVHPRQVSQQSPVVGYSWVSSVRALDDTISVRVPMVEGIPIPFTIAIPAPPRPDTSAFDHIHGTELHLDLPQDLFGADENARWSLDLGSSDGNSLILVGLGPQPQTLAVPWGWLGAVVVGDTLMATYERAVQRVESAAPFDIRLNRLTLVHWRIAIVPAP